MPREPVSLERALDASGVSIGVSLLLILLGVAALSVTGATAVAICMLILWIIVFSGLAHLVHAWDVRGTPLFLWRLLVGLAYLGGGLILLIYPGYSLPFIALFIGCMFGLESLLLFGAYSLLRESRGAGWIAVDGTFTLLVAMFIGYVWPWIPAWLLAVCVALNIISTGATRLALYIGTGHHLKDLRA